MLIELRLDIVNAARYAAIQAKHWKYVECIQI